MTDEWCPPSGEHAIPKNLDNVTASAEDTAREINAASPTANDSNVALGISEADMRLVDAFFHELALEASNDPSPPTLEEQAAIAASAAAFARLKAMTPDELRAERARRMRERRLRERR